MDKTAPPLLGTARDWAIDLAVATVIGLFFGLVGPFGSFINGSTAARKVPPSRMATFMRR